MWAYSYLDNLWINKIKILILRRRMEERRRRYQLHLQQQQPVEAPLHRAWLQCPEEGIVGKQNPLGSPEHRSPWEAPIDLESSTKCPTRETHAWKLVSTDGDDVSDENTEGCGEKRMRYKYSQEVGFRGGTGAGICSAVKLHFRNHLGLLCKFNNVLSYEKKLSCENICKFSHSSKVSAVI